MDIGLLLGFFLFSILLWINVLAILCLFLDPDLEPVQRWGQSIVVILFPFIGASLILHLVNTHSPEVIQRFYIPWPFSKLIQDSPVRPHNNNDDREETPGIHSAHLNRNHTEGGGD